MSPVELIKVAQQCAGGLTTTTTTATAGSASLSMQRVVQSVGSTPWCGLNATLLRDGIPHGVWFATYELTKDVMLSSTSNETTSLKDVIAVDESIPVAVPLVSGTKV